ncbi:hypothetical protein F7725_010112 [Dissostichus mawsoni]|uniref:Uncharacterized protein n=1 Tax=Dissostichus mawsoni TaxID=36200 RepID=A0A7J5XMR8_DISMA|nr:hypothetical protein F7725_010112 [Dissostichus mawsoni]
MKSSNKKYLRTMCLPWWVVIIGALYLLKLPSVLWHLTAIKLMRLSRKITDTDTMAISRYRFKSEKLSSFVGTCLN